jgi:hypothetical protein
MLVKYEEKNANKIIVTKSILRYSPTPLGSELIDFL